MVTPKVRRHSSSARGGTSVVPLLELSSEVVSMSPELLSASPVDSLELPPEVEFAPVSCAGGSSVSAHAKTIEENASETRRADLDMAIQCHDAARSEPQVEAERDIGHDQHDRDGDALDRGIAQLRSRARPDPFGAQGGLGHRGSPE